MSQGLRKSLSHVVPALVPAVVASAAWAAWLGWDQQRDVHPDGSSTGPYEPWQVIGLVLTLLPPVCWAAYRRRFAGSVLGPTAGLTLAALYDWSDDGSGLFVIGVGLVMAGTFAATAAVTAVISVLTPAGRNGRPMPA
ncbi:hypothetical protein SUDANB6_02781 [Streptomyces sp. enrichment culture]|uniref:hypothetical protein n=1 Tax=Streptomyces sp. enrichment culture TaxID=1795815 RepID=UPI003F55CF3B